jgi:hypothetical protein
MLTVTRYNTFIFACEKRFETIKECRTWCHEQLVEDLEVSYDDLAFEIHDNSGAASYYIALFMFGELKLYEREYPIEQLAGSEFNWQFSNHLPVNAYC